MRGCGLDFDVMEKGIVGGCCLFAEELRRAYFNANVQFCVDKIISKNLMFIEIHAFICATKEIEPK